jgi:methylenetetrahydrofolate--tRNA-(uracil-5-)-methyltransferase
LLSHITGGHVETIDAGPQSFQPMNVNFGLFPPLTHSASRAADGTRLRGAEKTMAKRRALTARALVDLDRWSRGLPAALEPAAGLVPAGEGAGLPEPHLR